MSAYELDRLLKLWATGKLTQEQIMGHLLLHMQALAERVGKLEVEQEQRRREGRGG